MSSPNEGAFTYVDTLSFTVLTQNGHTENQIQYGLHHREARHYLNSKDSVFISTMAGRDVYPTIDLLKIALINLPKLTFACFPNPQVGGEGDVANTKVFVVTRGVHAAVDISRWIWKCLEMITEVVDLPGYERHAATVEGYGCVSVCMGCFGDKLVLRIGLKDPTTREYHQDFAWVINKDVYYDDSYRDKSDEATLWLYPGGNTWGPVHGGECEAEKKWCVDQIARLIAGGIRHIRSGDLNRFGITMGFGQRAEKQRFLALFSSKELSDVIPFHTTYFERSMDVREETRPGGSDADDRYRSDSLRREEPRARGSRPGQHQVGGHPDDMRLARSPPEGIPGRGDEYRPRYRSRSRRRENNGHRHRSSRRDNRRRDRSRDIESSSRRHRSRERYRSSRQHRRSSSRDRRRRQPENDAGPSSARRNRSRSRGRYQSSHRHRRRSREERSGRSGEQRQSEADGRYKGRNRRERHRSRDRK